MGCCGRTGEDRRALRGGVLPSEKPGLVNQGRGDPRPQLLARCTVPDKVRFLGGGQEFRVRNGERQGWT